MKKIILLLFSICSIIYSFGQTVKIIEIKKLPTSALSDSRDYAIKFPVIITATDTVDKKINSRIRLAFFDSEYVDKRAEVGLDSAISNGLIRMSYVITFNRDNILSLTINAEGCGAYCSSWSTFFNFNTQTGNMISIEDIIKNDKTEIFRNLVFKEKTQALINYKSGLKEKLKKNDIDQDTYNWAIDEVDSDCILTISLDQFSLSSSEIDIIDDCGFPHAIQSLQPVYKLSYPYVSIREFLKPSWEVILIK